MVVLFCVRTFGVRVGQGLLGDWKHSNACRLELRSFGRALRCVISWVFTWIPGRHGRCWSDCFGVRLGLDLDRFETVA